MRILLASPFMFLGIALFKIGEFIAGEPYAYNAEKVLDIHKRHARCTECGHVGAVFLEDPEKNDSEVLINK